VVKEEELHQILSRLYPSTPWPKPFNLLRGKQLVTTGRSLNDAAREVGTTKARLAPFCSAVDGIGLIFGDEEPDERTRKSVRQILGNLIVGRCAEIVFERIYKEHTHTTELELRDLREGRSDTDYRLFNGRGRPVYRVNIKYHGSLFRRAKEMVGLEPHDCFALATYKIAGALQKQKNDELPYIFVVVSVPNLTADSIGAGVPAEIQDFVARVTHADDIPQKRNIEDRVVEVLQEEGHPAFESTLKQVASANWYILSARKAEILLRKMLFERVFALRTRNFSRQFGGAELDMHFSLSQDLTPLKTYLEMLREAGYPRVTTLLERGDY
jgi:hypothetical protein